MKSRLRSLRPTHGVGYLSRSVWHCQVAVTTLGAQKFGQRCSKLLAVAVGSMTGARRNIVLGLPLVVGAFVVACTSPRQDYSPEQPINYSHKLHAGDLAIDCKYCHVAVEQGRHASVPSGNICMNCHSAVGKDKDGVIKLAALHDEQRPVPWVKVHDLPDFVYFDHSRHIRQGFDCERCHGKVQEMPKVRVVERLNMGWCVECHRNPDPARPELKGPIDCHRCHR